MRTILLVCLVLTFLGAANSVIGGMTTYSLLEMIFGSGRSVGSDFMHLLTGFAAIIILIWGIRKLNEKESIVQTHE